MLLSEIPSVIKSLESQNPCVTNDSFLVFDYKDNQKILLYIKGGGPYKFLDKKVTFYLGYFVSKSHPTNNLHVFYGVTNQKHLVLHNDEGPCVISYGDYKLKINVEYRYAIHGITASPEFIQEKVDKEELKQKISNLK